MYCMLERFGLRNRAGLTREFAPERIAAAWSPRCGAVPCHEWSRRSQPQLSSTTITLAGQRVALCNLRSHARHRGARWPPPEVLKIRTARADRGSGPGRPTGPRRGTALDEIGGKPASAARRGECIARNRAAFVRFER